MCQRPPRNTSNQALKSIGEGSGWNVDVAKITVGVARGDIHAAAEGDRQMGEVAADADPFAIGFIGRARVSRILITEGQMGMDEVADGLHARPARRRRSEHIPGDLAQLVCFAIATAKEVGETFIRQLRDRRLGRVGNDLVRRAVVLDDAVA